MKKDQLEKGLAALQVAAEAGNPAARRNALLAKAQTEALTAEENEELIKSLGGGNELSAAALEPLQTEAMQKSLDVSEFLRDHHEGLEKSLGVLADRIEKGEGQAQGFRIALAQTLTSLGDMVKSLHDEVTVLKGMPAAPVKSQGVVGTPAEGASMEKSMAGTPPQGAKLNKGQVLDIMEAISEANNGFSKGGENMATAIAKYEGGTEISKGLAQEVMDHYRASRSRQSA